LVKALTANTNLVTSLASYSLRSKVHGRSCDIVDEVDVDVDVGAPRA